MDESKERLKSAKKISAVIIDLDETLWKGTIVSGEQIILHQDRYDLVKFFHDRGIQIFVVSRNDSAEVDKVFKILNVDKDLFTYVLANWESKTENISSLLKATDIKPETAVFIDDNAVLLEETRVLISGLHVLNPDDLSFLKQSAGVMSRHKESASESRARKSRYRLKIKERFLDTEMKSHGIEFQKQLQKKICIGIPPADNLFRVIKLLFTTHRLNFNPSQFESEDKLIESIYEKLNHGNIIYAVSASQGEISLGLIGAFVISFNENAATIENATFSCSSMGLGFEEKALIVLVRKLKLKGVNKLFVNVSTSSTNARIQKILWNFGFEFISQESGNFGAANCIFCLEINDFKHKNAFSWIGVSEKLNLDYPGIQEVMDFFHREVVPLINQKNSIVNLGSARGEVLGLMQKSRREEFDRILQSKKVSLANVDLEAIPEENNIVGDAENLQELFKDETQDQVWAIELLEHTLHPWKVLNEMMRIAKVGAYLFVSVPGKSFPKHEYPIDMWRIGPEALLKIFSPKYFLPIAFQNIGQLDNLRRTLILYKKIAATPNDVIQAFKPSSFIGEGYNQSNGIVYFD